MNIVVCGFGRAGKAMAQFIINEKKHNLMAIVCRESSYYAYKDIGNELYGTEIGIIAIPFSEAEDYLNNGNVDVIIDFSHKSLTLSLMELCIKINSKIVICTTNHTEQEIIEIKELSKKKSLGVVYAPNLTIGINILIDFVGNISKVLSDFDFEIIERHRRDKAPITNTARLIEKAIDRGKTPISSIRVGGYVGIHEVTAASEYERLTIVHESFSRNAFAYGAMVASNYIVGKNEFVSMTSVVRDVLYTAGG